MPYARHGKVDWGAAVANATAWPTEGFHQPRRRRDLRRRLVTISAKKPIHQGGNSLETLAAVARLIRLIIANRINRGAAGPAG